MNDENKENPNEHDEHENFEEDFEDFGLDDMPEHTEHDPLNEAPPAESGAPEQPSIERPAKKGGSFIPTIIGLAVVGFIGYKLYGKFIAHPENQEPEVAETTPLETAATPAPAPTPVPAPKPIEQPVAVAPPPAPAPTPAPAPQEEKLGKLSEAEFAKLHAKIEQQEKLIKQQIEALDKELQGSKQAAASTAQSVAGIQQSMSVLANAIQKLSAQMELIEHNQERDEIRRSQASENASSSSKSSGKGKGKAEALPSLTIYAIIPGRAWLRTANGKTISVAEGDPIEEYGRVLKIDASSGVVITTSGVTLR